MRAGIAHLLMLAALGIYSEPSRAAEDEFSQRPAILVQKQYPIRYDEQPTSWFGGKPSMPEKLDWPSGEHSFSGEQGRGYLPFVAQIDLASLPEDIWGGKKPKSGWLLFFKGKVVYSTELGSERSMPSDLPPIDMREPSSSIAAYDPSLVRHYRKWPVDFVRFTDTTALREHVGREQARIREEIDAFSTDKNGNYRKVETKEYWPYRWRGAALFLREVSESVPLSDYKFGELSIDQQTEVSAATHAIMTRLAELIREVDGYDPEAPVTARFDEIFAEVSQIAFPRFDSYGPSRKLELHYSKRRHELGLAEALSEMAYGDLLGGARTARLIPRNIVERFEPRWRRQRYAQIGGRPTSIQDNGIWRLTMDTECVEKFSSVIRYVSSFRTLSPYLLLGIDGHGALGRGETGDMNFLIGPECLQSGDLHKAETVVNFD